jgi:hypothetical protein
MSATGLDVFHKTLQTTNIWLDALPENIRALWPTGAEARPFEPAA